MLTKSPRALLLRPCQNKSSASSTGFFLSAACRLAFCRFRRASWRQHEERAQAVRSLGPAMPPLRPVTARARHLRSAAEPARPCAFGRPSSGSCRCNKRIRTALPRTQPPLGKGYGAGFARLSDIAPSIVQHMRYAGPNNAGNTRRPKLGTGKWGHRPIESSSPGTAASTALTARACGSSLGSLRC